MNNEIDGLLTAGQNSLLVLGDTDTGWALDAFGRSSLQWGQNGVTAALAIRKPQTLNGTLGAVMVDGTKTSAPVLTPNTRLSLTVLCCSLTGAVSTAPRR
ncbi:MAG: hypothetical protein ACLRWP_19260 [Bilophila wadsworthia]